MTRSDCVNNLRLLFLRAVRFGLLIYLLVHLYDIGLS